MLFKLPDQLVVKTWTWIPREIVVKRVDGEVTKGISWRHKRDRANYTAWHEAGWMHYTVGSLVDYDTVEAAILAAADRYRILEIACDRHEATGAITRLSKAGLKVIPLAQSAAIMNAGTKELMRHHQEPSRRQVVRHARLRGRRRDALRLFE